MSKPASESLNSTAWAFLVVSAAQQADTLSDQELWAQETAASKGWSITRTFSGVSSGKNGARSLTLTMLSALAALTPAQRPQRILMIRLERLGRGNGLEAMEAFLEIRKLNVVVHTRLDGDVNYHRASELLMPVLRFFIGGMENEVRRDKLNTMYQNRRDLRLIDPTIAISMRPPYGLSYVDGHVAPKPAEAAAVRLAYELRIEGYSTTAIAKRLKAVAPPAQLKDGTLRPQHWDPTRVSRLISKPTYRGVIVDEQTWFAAQRRPGLNQRPSRRYDYVFSGALRCECGYTLAGQKGTGKKSSTFRYYQCRNQDAHVGRYKHHRSDRLEAQFCQIMSALVADPSLLQTYVQTSTSNLSAGTIGQQMDACKVQKNDLVTRRRLIFNAFENHAITTEDLQWRLNDLKEFETELDAQMRELDAMLRSTNNAEKNITSVQALVAGAGALWSQGAIDDRKALVKAIRDIFQGLIVLSNGTLVLGCTLPDGVKIATKRGIIEQIRTGTTIADSSGGLAAVSLLLPEDQH